MLCRQAILNGLHHTNSRMQRTNTKRERPRRQTGEATQVVANPVYSEPASSSGPALYARAGTLLRGIGSSRAEPHDQVLRAEHTQTMRTLMQLLDRPCPHDTLDPKQLCTAA